MVLILDGNSAIGAQVKENMLFDLFKAFDKFKNSHKLDSVFFSEKSFFPSCVRNMF